MAKSGFRELTIDSKERVNAVVALDLRTVQAHTGETARLYELRPGEDIASITAHEPLDKARVSQTLKFRFPLNDNGRTRLYSSFAVVFEDGSLLSTDGYYIQNPQRLAVDTRAFPWASSPKGLCVDDADDAVALGAMHAMYEITLSELMNGNESISFGGNTYSVSADVLTGLDRQIGRADALGMQVSLTLHVDLTPTHDAYAALIDHLIARYTKDGHCALTAVFLRTPDATEAATLCRLTDLALRSRTENGRVYISPIATTLDETKVFFSTMQAQLLVGGAMNWGAAVTPQYDDSAAIAEKSGIENAALTLSDLSALSDFLLNTQTGAATWLAVCGLSFSASDTDGQAASYACAYRQSISAHADLIFYKDHVDEPAGLRDANGNARRILSLFASIDTGLSTADRQLCLDRLGEKWDSNTNDLISRQTVSGIANTGLAGLEETPLFDFTTGECYDFCGIGASGTPESHHSAFWNAPVLYTWINPRYGEAGGICKCLHDASVLKNASSTSIRLLCQIPDTEVCTVQLTLEGTTAQGERLTYRSDVEIQSGVWQTATFQIGNFIADADLSQTVVLTLTTSADTDTDEDYVLWVNSIDIRRPEKGLGTYLPVAVIGACLAIGFLAVFLIYRKTKYQRKC